jgi:hypothetical protein
VLAAVGLGRRTYGELCKATGLGHETVVLAVQRLTCDGRIVARSDGHVRMHYLAGEPMEHSRLDDEADTRPKVNPVTGWTHYPAGVSPTFDDEADGTEDF